MINTEASVDLVQFVDTWCHITTLNRKAPDSKWKSSVKMAKFKVLKYNEFSITRLGFCPFEFLSKPIRNEFFKSLSTYFIVMHMVAFLICSLTCVYQNMSRIDVALRTSIVTIGTSQALCMIISFGSKMKKIKAVHLKLQQIVDATPPGLKTLFIWLLLLLHSATGMDWYRTWAETIIRLGHLIFRKLSSKIEGSTEIK